MASQPQLFQQHWPEGEYRLFQLGFVVTDLVAAASMWAEVHGVGPFHVMPPVTQACTYRGEPSEISLQYGVSQAGPVQIELIEDQGERASVFNEPGRASPTGFHQICTVTRDYEGKKSFYQDAGYELACELAAPDGQRVAYLDTVADFGFFVEVVEETPLFLKLLGGISATCADWDGQDPVRLLTRDGYRVP
jgi:hypothetical protein